MSQPLNPRPRLQALRDRLTHLTEAEADEAPMEEGAEEDEAPETKSAGDVVSLDTFRKR